ncbi:3,4-dihydroxy-2-butanone-4-phosphate synthase [Citricoccus nitrophenolicus]|uniref:Multifunctional fusion protein n=1 Tax=Citricoccus muralis TaxID=169134 RepID=A0A3D9L9F3_9MICC|nr:3,4-dihydroxy-2-butanone-4-phosphate synthase [Citricoccus muralis]REE02999.1 3,4-dihydroxy 2-butanone 4-phosphate synthase/GTP cyclohydrolase II [Citricoccus muralis]
MSAQEAPNYAPIRLDSIETAIAAISAGRAVVVVDDADRENEGDIVFAADAATPEIVALTVRYTSGVLCAPMPADVAERLDLPPMTARNEDPKGTAYTVSCDAIAGTTTGISAADRATTLKVLADPSATADLVSRPGHVFPLVAAAGGVAERRGHTEAAVELSRLAGRAPVGAIAELVNDDGSMMRLPVLRRFADRHRLPLISIEDLVAYLAAEGDEHREVQGAEPAEEPDTSTPTVNLPTRYGTFQVSVHPDQETGAEHVVLQAPEAGTTGLDRSPLVRLHSECLTGDVFGSERCDCGAQLEHALWQAMAEGGTVIYLRGHEGRGIGLANKILAYALQDSGLDTVAANEHLGLPADARSYRSAAAILRRLGLDRIRLVTNNPDKSQQLEREGIEVAEIVPSPAPVTEHNRGYLTTKRDRMAHRLSGDLVPRQASTMPGSPAASPAATSPVTTPTATTPRATTGDTA